MMEKVKQERYSDFIDLPNDLFEKIIRTYDKEISVLSYAGIGRGRANSNYEIKTSKGKVMLRVCRSESVYKNEIIVNKELDKSISRPELLHYVVYDDKPYLFYEFIESSSLGSYTSMQDSVVGKVALLCAQIHNTSKEKVKDVIKPELPPFYTWYDYFLDNPNTIRRIGMDIQVKLKRIIGQCNEELKLIDSTQTVIHNDFRPDNMIIDRKDNLLITDWEAVTINHRITDVGQFFRHSKMFSNEQIKLFEYHYNREACIPLPQNWFRLSKIRDLVNLLQLISSNRDLPSYHNTIRSLISDSIAYLDQHKE